MTSQEFRVKRRILIDAINAAFRDVELEDGITLRQAVVLDSDGDEAAQAEARRRDVGIHWTQISHQTFKEEYFPLSFLDPKGFRFYLPAFMLAELKEERALFNSIAFNLMQESGISQRKTQPANIAAKYSFSPAQIRVIADFLQFLHPEEEGISEPDQLVLSRWRALADEQPHTSLE